MIETKDIHKNFGEIQAVRGVSFNVAAGEIFGFLGPNGAGKTTTINILCTLVVPDSGVATLAGFDVVKQPEKVRSSIGIVFQDPSLDERLTAEENLQFHGMIYGVPKAQRNERISNVMNMVELWDRRHDIVKTFSGGMKRRLEIARGLMHHPRVLFLDEPTLGLDPQTRNRIWKYIRELRDRENITIFLTTHYMDEAENCDRIAIIDNGRIISLDTPEKLKKMVGGDVITVSTSDNKAAMAQLAKSHDIESIEQDSKIVFEVSDGETFLPKLVHAISVSIDSVSLRRPTLDDVFLKLTGHTIREESIGALDSMRAHVRMRRR
ncbi:MAG TPA: ATP-binding cassette domain-containing protein [Actinobacteria bacterium]|nr:ATP-binding cassette domain-containing protein [Actinomycetota bacterium]